MSMTPSERMALCREWKRVPLDDLAEAIEALVETWRHMRRTSSSDSLVETARETLSTLLELWRERTDSRHFVSAKYAILIDEGPGPEFTMTPARPMAEPSLN